MLRAQKCCSVCVKTRLRKVTAVVKAVAAEAMVAVVVADAAPKGHAAMVVVMVVAMAAAKAVAVNTLRAHKVHAPHRVKATAKAVAAVQSVTHNHVAMKAALPVAWAVNRAAHAQHKVSLTPCAPVSI